MAPIVHGAFDGGFGWISFPDEFMERSSAALAAGGKVWLVDPVRTPEVDERIRALGSVAGVVLTMGWHERDADWFAALHGVPVYIRRGVARPQVAAEIVPVDGAIPGSPLTFLPIDARGVLSLWRAGAVWWPERRVLAVGDCLGTASYFVRPGERLAVHPIRRFAPPHELAALDPERLYVGHGPSLEGGVREAIGAALATAKSELVSGWRSSAAAALRHLRRR